jgi:hypothetical protein
MTAFAEFGVRCILDCGCPLSSAKGGTFFWASQAQGGAPEGLRGAQGAFRGGMHISASPGAPLRSYHPLLVGAPICYMEHAPYGG